MVALTPGNGGRRSLSLFVKSRRRMPDARPRQVIEPRLSAEAVLRPVVARIEA